jgi:radical SAM superfamily enzyme YgiQ (UPF0313 family)
MRILLINPSTEDDFFSDAVRDISYLKSGAFFAPHAVASVAALTPRHHQITIHDEQLHGPVESHIDFDDFDVVGVSLLATHLGRTIQIAEAFKKKERAGKLAIGGIGTPYMIPSFRGLVDTIFFGETEDTWSEYLKDIENGNAKPVYQRYSKPDMTKVAIPRWDLIADDIPRYATTSVQTTRGCPFDCNFCDVVYTYGRHPRSKTVEQVLNEVRFLKNLGTRMIYIADDNFCGNKKMAKDVLRQLVKLNNSFSTPLGFITQADITISKDEDLLMLLADCNVQEVQIGIESISPNSLQAMNKTQNSNIDLLESIQKIQSYGIPVMGHFIIGNDTDNENTFQQTLEFIDRANILHHICHTLMAPPGTELWYTLRREGRIVAGEDGITDNQEMIEKQDIMTNIIPKNMTRVELFERIADYWENAFDYERYTRRAIGFLRGIKRTPKIKSSSLKTLWEMKETVFLVYWYYLRHASAENRKAFFQYTREGAKHPPSMMPTIIFTHTSFYMDRIRALRAAKIVRERATWEWEHPERIQTLPPTTPLSSAFRESFRDIFNAAYLRIRPQVGDREQLYQAVIESMVDYSDRYGVSFLHLDEVQLDRINDCCDRVLARIEADTSHRSDNLPEDRPPRGFAREILDGLHHALRFREISADRS